MKTINSIADTDQRDQALDPGRSFIVQAPAGSGKTELLIQRYLTLLSLVESPEEIIAITFTRKAAAEMRSRILQALDRGRSEISPAAPHEVKTWELARAALKNNDQRNWMIAENPLRFKIQTIDSLCAGLTRQMPMLSKFGAQPGIMENADLLYREAARNTIADLESGLRWSPAIEMLIRHLDNHLEKVEGLIAGMLARRDQWLRHVAGKEQRQSLEDALANMIREALDSVRSQIPESGVADLLELAGFAAANLKQWGMESPICQLDGLSELPGASPEEKPQWLGVCELLLTKEGQWRKSVNKNMGFPAPSSAKKGSELQALFQEKKSFFEEYMDSLSGNEGLAAALHNVRFLPDATYSDAQWDIMEALFEILLVAVSHLEIVFGESGQVDFAEIAMRASKALGDPESPTDLTLALDYRIRHILVDEFQDTSFTQYELLERLTAGWEPSDGRTFFAVGDPMQSIYGFREAEVGLFIKARNHGLGQIVLHPLTLTVNFRSQEKIVDWINDTFPHAMPATEDETTGAVSYSPSVARHAALEGEAVIICPFIPPDPRSEAASIIRCIQDAREAEPDSKIAILVRSRSHLESIVALLKSSGIPFRAVEIESLKNRPVIMDLISLARAISHPADRIAWLAVLRAPWCGLALNDLFVLAGGSNQRTVLDLMFDELRVAEMSDDGRKRLLHVRQILLESIRNRRRNTFRREVEGVWLKLGGPACGILNSDLEDASVFFELLDQQVGTGALTDINGLETAASKLFALPDTQTDDRLQIMTIHKAKGLEFDIVILPGLEKTPPPADPQLLLWLEKYSGSRSELLLAPIAETGGDVDKIYNYIKLLHDKKRDLEDSRVLYVAATRAKKRLYLMGGAQMDRNNTVRPPGAKSLLAKIWPVVKDAFFDACDDSKIQTMDLGKGDEPSPQITVPFIRRFQGDLKIPQPAEEGVQPSGAGLLVEEKKIEEMPLFDWAGETVRRSGTVIHQWLKMICEDGIERWTRERIRSQAKFIRQDLARAGVSPESIDDSADIVISALEKTMAHDRGIWILSRHLDGACEHALTGVVDGRITNVVLDRTFIDESGIRWIIDYKSGVHRGGALDVFLAQEKERYRSQMEQYGRLMAARSDAPIMIGLYFPRLQGWQEWAFIPS
jgi:ATP-dependent helicase/nuclease subunit A